MLFLLFASSATFAQATITTDRVDYLPGDTVHVTGTGWLPGETVHLVLTETPLIHPPIVKDLIADLDSNIADYEFYHMQDHDTGQVFTLTATGLTSGYTASTTFIDLVGPGVAPTELAGNGFGIEGNLFANSPNVSSPAYNNASDWLDGDTTGGKIGVGILNNNGTPKDGALPIPITNHVLDLTGNSDLNTFAESDKVSHDPNTYDWKAGSVPQKDDIQNGLIYLTSDASGNLWAIMAGDRRAINGTSYIDFEFLQNSLLTNPDGTFSSAGPDGGRTDGDFLLTIELRQGGSRAQFFMQRWSPDSSGGVPTGTFSYRDFTPPINAAFVSANTDSTVGVPYGAFGSTTYGINQFGEAAANLTDLVGSFNPCFTGKTVFIRTKSSASPTAQLKDFIEPIQLRFSAAANAFAGPDTSFTCTVSQIQLHGQTSTPSPTIFWTAINGGHIVSGANTLDPFIDSVGTYILTVSSDFGCSFSDTVNVTLISNPPPCSISVNGPFCPSTTNQHCGPVGMASYSWSVSGNGSISGSSTGQCVNVLAGSGCNATYTLSLTVTNASGCSTTCNKEVLVIDTTKPVITCPANQTFECSAIGAFNNASATDNCGAPTVTEVRDTTPGNCPQEKTIRRIWTAVDACGNSSQCTSFVNIEDNTAPVFVACGRDTTLPCESNVVFTPPTASDNCDNNVIITVASNDTAAGPNGSTIYSRTWLATDHCGNVSDTCEQSITVEICPTFCTLTQGAYGNAGGKFNGIGRLQLIQNLLTPSPLVIGKPGRSFTVYSSSAQCIIDRLPAGGPAATLPAGLGDATLGLPTCQTSPVALPLKNGRFRSVFLGQLVTLSLNARLSPGLGNVGLCATITTTKGSKSIPGPVLSALTANSLPQTVNGLIELANRAIAGWSVGANLSQISGACGSINEVFDECARLVSCSAAAVGTVEHGDLEEVEGTETSIPSEFALHVNYPNPFNPTTKIKFDLPEASNVHLSIFNMLGQEVTTLVNGQVYAGYQAIEWKATSNSGDQLPSGIYIYRLQATSLMTGKEFQDVRKMVLMK